MLAWLRGLARVDPGASLQDAARRVAGAVVSVLRVGAVLTITALALLSPHVDVAAVAALGVLGVAHTVLTSRALASNPSTPGVVVGTLAGDLVLVISTIAASGQADSRVVLPVTLVPALIALIADARRVIAFAALGTVGYAIAAGVGQPLVVFALELGWATAIGAAMARRRNRLQATFARLDAMLGALGADPTESLLDRVGPELRMVALAPVRSVAMAVRRPGESPSPPELRALAARLGTATLRTRSIVSDLYAFSGASDALSGALQRLGERRAPEARVEVVVSPELDAQTPDRRRNGLVLAVVRDALGVVADGELRSLRLSAVVRGGAMRISMRAELPAAGPRAVGERSRRALAGRVAAAGGRLVAVAPDRVEVSLPAVLLEAADDDAAVPVAPLDGRVPLVAVVRLTAPPAMAAVAAVVGGVHGGFWWILGAWMLLGIPDLALLLRRMPGPSVLAARFTLGGAVAALLLDRAGHAQMALTPFVVFLPMAVAVLLRPRAVVAVSVLTAVLVMVAVGGQSDAAAVAVAFAYSALAAVTVSSGSQVIASGLGSAARRRTDLLVRALELEDAARRRLAGELHDDALQLMLAARQDLEEAAEGDAAALVQARAGLAEVLLTLQRAVEELDVGEAAREVSSGLQIALTETARALVRPRADGTLPEVYVEVAPAASGVEDGAVVRLVRELLSNAMRHAGARRISVGVWPDAADGVVVEVFDDGVGFDRARVQAAVGLGHIGLAAAAERIEANGGRLELLDREGGGALVRALLPARGPRAFDAAGPGASSLA